MALAHVRAVQLIPSAMVPLSFSEQKYRAATRSGTADILNPCRQQYGRKASIVSCSKACSGHGRAPKYWQQTGFQESFCHLCEFYLLMRGTVLSTVKLEFSRAYGKNDETSWWGLLYHGFHEELPGTRALSSTLLLVRCKRKALLHIDPPMMVYHKVIADVNY